MERKTRQDLLEKNSKVVEEYLDGIRKSNLICTTHAIAKKLCKKYDIDLKVTKIINKDKGVCMFAIVPNKK